MNKNALNSLQKRNNHLKSILLYDKLKHGNFTFRSFKREMIQILNAYHVHKSIYKASSTVGVNANIALKWYVQGQMGNSNFKFFYDGIKAINNFEVFEDENYSFDDKPDYGIEKVDNSWIYTTYVDGEKISIISADFNNLKEKVLNKNLPII